MPTLPDALRRPLAAALALAALASGVPLHAAETAAELRPAVEAALRDYAAGRFEAAREAFEALSRRGLPLADFNLAMMHLRDELPSPSTTTALALLARAAEGGFVTAQVTLGQIHESGELVPRDLEAANRWYERAARSGSVDAQVAIGTAHYLGRGAAQDAERAAHWYREAAKGGDVGAQYLIASMYERGLGVARDLRLARYWYDIAARNGDEAAPSKRRELDERLSRPST